ncbi:hypothetical protein [Pseudodesulfovibrio karagichevae]|uniref:Transmembrane protein n=1 Tax=Pseudodesulfovibrio karagichevae TaxID=3239305 RepID=A0ABV4K4F9_9BACT
MAESKDENQNEKRGEINGMSYGKIMTSLLIPKDSRTSPRRVLSGVAFLAFVCFFVFGTMYRGCANRNGFGCTPPGVERIVPAAPQAPAGGEG